VFLRAACMKWLRPIPTMSPSPPKTTTSVWPYELDTCRHGYASAVQRVNESARKYGDGIHEEQPMPLAKQNLSKFSLPAHAPHAEGVAKREQAAASTEGNFSLSCTCERRKLQSFYFSLPESSRRSHQV